MKFRDSFNIGLPMPKPGTTLLHRFGGGIPFKDDLSSYLNERDGLTLVDSIGSNDATILPAVAQFNPSDSAHLLLTDEITFTNGEIIIHAAQALGNTSAQGFLFGNGGTSWFCLRTTSAIWLRFSGTLLQFAVANWSTTEINIIRAVVTNDTTTKVRLWCNGVESSSGELDAGSLVSMVVQAVGYTIEASVISYVNIVNNGATVLTYHPTGLGLYEYDESGNANTGTWAGTPETVFMANGNSHMLNSGFSIYEKANCVDEYVPNGGDAGVIIDTTERVNYSLKESVLGYSSKHNLAPSLIQFSEDVWDRSDTDIWEDAARAGYYDDTSATTKKRWHSSELNQATFKLWLKAAYQEIVFTKFSDNSIDTGKVLQEIFSYLTVKTTSELSKVLSYTGYKFNPKGVTSQFIVDTILTQLDWTDAYSGAATYEIWRAYNGDDKVLIDTTSAGAETYNDTTCKQNISVKYWIRAKVGSTYSAFTSVDLLQTYWCMKTNQSTLTTLTMQKLSIYSGSVTIHWGDDTTSVLSAGVNSNIVHDYGVGNEGQYNIWFTGDGFNQIYTFEFYDYDDVLYGDITNWVFPARLIQWHFYNNWFTGEITDHINWIPPSMHVYDIQNMEKVSGSVTDWRWDEVDAYDIHFEGTLVEGNITNWTFPAEVDSSSAKYMLFNSLLEGVLTNWVMSDGIHRFLIYASPGFEIDITNFYIPDSCTNIAINTAAHHVVNLHGDLSGFVFPTGESLYASNSIEMTDSGLTGDMRNSIIPEGTKVMVIDFARNAITHLPRGNFKWVNVFTFTANNCDSDEIDDFLAYVDDYFISGTVPMCDCQYSIGGTGMGIPSAAGLASKSSIEGKYTSAGFTTTILVNS